MIKVPFFDGEGIKYTDRERVKCYADGFFHFVRTKPTDKAQCL